jgi:hypothetical protein
MSDGTPMNWRRGSGRSAPSVQIADDVGPGVGALVAQPGLGDQRGPLRTGDQQCLGSLVDGGAGDLGDDSLPPSRGDPLEHGHPHGLVPEEERRREPGDPAAHDHHVRPRVRRLHVSSLADAARCGVPEVGGRS